MMLGELVASTVLLTTLGISTFITLKFYKPRTLKELVFGVAGTSIWIMYCIVVGFFTLISEMLGLDYGFMDLY